jgi:thiol-disulfide isomerase/thioredoxin
MLFMHLTGGKITDYILIFLELPPFVKEAEEGAHNLYACELEPPWGIVRKRRHGLMRRRTVSVFLLAFLAVLALGWGAWTLAASQDEEDGKILVLDFSLMNIENETFRLSDYRGQIVVLNFWASWCPPCKAEMPEFQELHNELVESGDAVLLLLNQVDGWQETAEKGAKFLEDNNLTMTNLLDDGTVGSQIFGIPGLPTTVVIDAEGYFSSYVVGSTTKATVLRMIEDAR